MRKGRKPIYHPENLEVGGKIKLSAKISSFGSQYAKMFRDRLPGKEFKKVVENGKVFIERTL